MGGMKSPTGWDSLASNFCASQWDITSTSGRGMLSEGDDPSDSGEFVYTRHMCNPYIYRIHWTCFNFCMFHSLMIEQLLLITSLLSNCSTTQELSLCRILLHPGAELKSACPMLFILIQKPEFSGNSVNLRLFKSNDPMQILYKNSASISSTDSSSIHPGIHPVPATPWPKLMMMQAPVRRWWWATEFLRSSGIAEERTVTHGINGDSMVIQWDLMGFNADSMGFNEI